jgi:hypothetical protein
MLNMQPNMSGSLNMLSPVPAASAASAINTLTSPPAALFTPVIPGAYGTNPYAANTFAAAPLHQNAIPAAATTIANGAAGGQQLMQTPHAQPVFQRPPVDFSALMPHANPIQQMIIILLNNPVFAAGPYLSLFQQTQETLLWELIQRDHIRRMLKPPFGTNGLPDVSLHAASPAQSPDASLLQTPAASSMQTPAASSMQTPAASSMLTPGAKEKSSAAAASAGTSAKPGRGRKRKSASPTHAHAAAASSPSEIGALHSTIAAAVAAAAAAAATPAVNEAPMTKRMASDDRRSPVQMRRFGVTVLPAIFCVRWNVPNGSAVRLASEAMMIAYFKTKFHVWLGSMEVHTAMPHEDSDARQACKRSACYSFSDLQSAVAFTLAVVQWIVPQIRPSLFSLAYMHRRTHEQMPAGTMCFAL